MIHTNTPPLISIIIASYNHESYIAKTIESAISQTYENLELIIIDDGSKDNSNSVISQFHDRCKNRFVNYKYISRENKGLSRTLNEAIDLSSGDYIMPIGSDDIVLENKCADLIGYLCEDYNLSAVFGCVIYIDENDKKSGQQSPYFHEHSFDELIMSEKLPLTPGVLLRKSSVLSIGGFSQSIRLEDWYMWLKLSEAGFTLRTVDIIVAKYRVHSTNTSNNYEWMRQELLKTVDCFKYHELYFRACSRINYVAALSARNNNNIVDVIRYLSKSNYESWNKKLKCIFLTIFPKPKYLIRKFKSK